MSPTIALVLVKVLTFQNHGGFKMLHWALMFLLVAIIAAVFGFGGVAIAAAGIAKLIFVIFLVLFLVSLITHFGRGRRSA